MSYLVFFLLLFALGAAPKGYAQGKLEPAKNNDKSSTPRGYSRDGNDAIPTRQITFDETLIAGVIPSLAIVLPPQCASDGTLYLDMLVPSDVRKHVVYRIDKNESKSFSTSSIAGLNDITMLGMGVTSSNVVFLLNAKNGNDNEKRFYIAEFNKDGNYEKSVPIGMAGTVFKLAAFDSGGFVATGFDSTQNGFVFLLLDQDGDVKRSINLPSIIRENKSDGVANVDANSASMLAIASVLFVPYRGNILAWRPGINHIFEIRPSGSIRDIAVAPPDGLTIADIVPSNSHLIVHFRSQFNSNIIQNQKNFVYYEVNPEDGSLIAKLVISGNDTSIIACNNDDEYISFTSNSSKFFLLTSE